MKVTVYGPNLPTPGETFHVHATGCADTKRGIYPRLGADQGGWDIDVDTVAEVVELVYSDQMDEDPEYNTVDNLLSDFRFFPCTADLPD